MKTIKIKKPAHFNFRECLWFLDRGFDDCMHTVLENSVLKPLRINKKPVLIEVSETPSFINIVILKGTVKDKQYLVNYMEEWLDISRDIRPFYKLLKDDKDLSVLVKNFEGLRIIGIPDLFEVLCWCIIGQQINLNFAYKVKRRFVERYGEKFEFEGKQHFLFPDPKIIQNLSVEQLKSLQFTARKAHYLIGVANLYAGGSLSKEKIKALGDEKKMIHELMKIKGVGEWTANYTLMKCFRVMNGVPYGDSGINNGLFKLKAIPKKNNRKEVDKVFNKFTGWKTYLVFYIWRSLRS